MPNCRKAPRLNFIPLGKLASGLKFEVASRVIARVVQPVFAAGNVESRWSALGGAASWDQFDLAQPALLECAVLTFIEAGHRYTITSKSVVFQTSTDGNDFFDEGDGDGGDTDGSGDGTDNGSEDSEDVTGKLPVTGTSVAVALTLIAALTAAGLAFVFIRRKGLQQD